MKLRKAERLEEKIEIKNLKYSVRPKKLSSEERKSFCEDKRLR